VPRPKKPSIEPVVIRFGAGLNTRTPETRIQPAECADGKNFDLDIKDALFARRRPFDLVATAPNAQAIKGFAQLEKRNGTLTTLIQAGTTMYTWNGESTFVQVGTVASGARLRGPLTANWPLDEVALIADLDEQEPVLSWDGTNLTTLAHNLGGDFFARYIAVEDERAYFANVKSGATATPHMLVGSKRGDQKTLDVANRPASGLSDEDPWFLLTPNLRAINGLVSAFDRVVLSTKESRIYSLLGSSAQVSTTTDAFRFAKFYAGSGAVGDEAMVFVGNDIYIGNVGRIESLAATDTLGQVNVNDLTRQILDDVKDIDDWTLVFNEARQKVLCFSPDKSRVFVFHKSFLDAVTRGVAAQQQGLSEISPWSVWQTDHGLSFQPQAVWSMKRPTDKLHHVYMGGAAGEIFQLEGSGGQDGGTADITAERLSGVVSAPLDGEVFNVSGWVSYRRKVSGTLTITFEYGGLNLFDQAITVTLDPTEKATHYGGVYYYGGATYYGAQFEGRLHRKRFSIASGDSSQFQVRASFTGATEQDIEEIGIIFQSR